MTRRNRGLAFQSRVEGLHVVKLERAFAVGLVLGALQHAIEQADQTQVGSRRQQPGHDGIVEVILIHHHQHVAQRGAPAVRPLRARGDLRRDGTRDLRLAETRMARDEPELAEREPPGHSQ